MEDKSQKKSRQIPDIDVSKLSPEQQFIMQKWANMVGDVLGLIEIAIPEGQQLNSLRRKLQNTIYEYRHEFLQYFEPT